MEHLCENKDTRTMFSQQNLKYFMKVSKAFIAEFISPQVNLRNGTVFAIMLQHFLSHLSSVVNKKFKTQENESNILSNKVLDERSRLNMVDDTGLKKLLDDMLD